VWRNLFKFQSWYWNTYVVQKLGELNTVFVNIFPWWTLLSLFWIQVGTQKHFILVKLPKPAGSHVRYDLPSLIFMATTSVPEISKLCDSWCARYLRGTYSSVSSTWNPMLGPHTMCCERKPLWSFGWCQAGKMACEADKMAFASHSARAQATFASQSVNSPIRSDHLWHLLSVSMFLAGSWP
jgi:hypothetical protein